MGMVTVSLAVTRVTKDTKEVCNLTIWLCYTPKLHLSWKMTKKTVGFRGATTSSLIYCSLTSYFGQGKSRVHNFKPDENCWRGHPVSLRFFEDFHLKGLRTFQRVHISFSAGAATFLSQMFCLFLESMACFQGEYGTMERQVFHQNL